MTALIHVEHSFGAVIYCNTVDTSDFAWSIPYLLVDHRCERKTGEAKDVMPGNLTSDAAILMWPPLTSCSVEELINSDTANADMLWR